MLPSSRKRQQLVALETCPRFLLSTPGEDCLSVPRPVHCREPQSGFFVRPSSSRSQQAINKGGDSPTNSRLAQAGIQRPIRIFLADRVLKPLRGGRTGQEWIADQFGPIRVVAVKIGVYAIEDGQGLPPQSERRAV